MWALNNQTKFKADRTFARDRDGAEVWIVAVRATFSIENEATARDARAEAAIVRHEEQQDVCLAPVYFGEPGRSSLRYDTDLVRTKPGTDVLLHAHAHAPGGRPAPFVDVAMRVGPITKGLRIVGDRVWTRGVLGLTASDPLPFITKPIRYEHAWGGRLPSGEAFDPSNPIGVGRAPAAGQPLPSCEIVGRPIVFPSDGGGPPAGFGPIPYDWQPRAKLAGTYDEVWKNERRPLVPVDFEDAYFRSAPLDQQVNGFLRGGEEVILLRLTREGSLRFRLPRIRFGFATRIARDIAYHDGELSTVIIEPEERRLIMVWQTALPCHHTLYALEETVVFEKRRISREEPEYPEEVGEVPV
jgi:hypothetical protein